MSSARRTPSSLRPGRARAVCAVVLWVFATQTGCGNVRTFQPAVWNGTRARVERLGAVYGPNVVVEETLLRHGLSEAGRNDLGTAAQALTDRLESQPQAVPDDILALGELCYRAGLAAGRSETETRLRFFRDAAVLATLALAEPDLLRPAAAVELHNRAVARLIRLAQTRDDRPWQAALAESGLVPTSSSAYLAPERFFELKVAADYSVTGMANVYRSCGLGVPLVAHRTIDANTADLQERYFPRRLQTAATAVAVPGGGLAGGAWRRTPAALTMFDPFTVKTVTTGGRENPLASDRTTPLAVQVTDRNMRLLELTGLFESKFRDGVEAGLYMLGPYQPGKIPVVLVHGLFSSPRAWVQTINELRNDPEVAKRYQVWVFLYPTGQPIPRSATQLRRSLVNVRESLDPAHSDPAFDRMVVVGHSMGGLLTKMMVQDTGLALWNATIHVPYEQFQAPDRVREELREMLVFRPLPFVRRVVFIATPHRGSRLANDLLGRVVSGLVRRPDGQAAVIEELEELNGDETFDRELKGRNLTSVGNLRTDSPILNALDRIPIHQSVPYHSIIPQVAGNAGNTDTVVAYSSSHLPGSTSELVLPGTHFSQQKAQVTDEVKRILQEHLDGP